MIGKILFAALLGCVPLSSGGLRNRPSRDLLLDLPRPDPLGLAAALLLLGLLCGGPL